MSVYVTDVVPVFINTDHETLSNERSIWYELTASPLLFIGAIQSSLICAPGNGVAVRLVGASGGPYVELLQDGLTTLVPLALIVDTL